ncbi:MAG: cytochrome c [Verrucomicrobia bacterium]|nr:cytochrome c [Verrucomicrobiota bacterium]
MSTKSRLTLAAIGACWIAFAAPAQAGSPNEATTSPSAVAPAPELINRGRYLVERVGMCADCHGPRNEKGQLIMSQWLKGSPLPFQPMVPMPWSPAAPAIAGLPSMTTEQAVAFLQTGVRADGSRPLPPMPEFRFSEADATAVVAYLKSLP